MIFTLTVLRKIANVVSVTLVIVGLTGAAIYSFVWHVSPYTAVIGWSGYLMIAIVVMVWHLVRMARWETTLDEVHTVVCETSDQMQQLKDYVERNV